MQEPVDPPDLHTFLDPAGIIDDVPEKFVVKVLAENLRRLMDDRGMVQADLARLSGIDQSLISRILRASHSPKIDTVDSLARAFDLMGWHLLLPGLDPRDRPVLAMKQSERDVYVRLQEEFAKLPSLGMPDRDQDPPAKPAAATDPDSGEPDLSVPGSRSPGDRDSEA